MCRPVSSGLGGDAANAFHAGPTMGAVDLRFCGEAMPVSALGAQSSFAVTRRVGELSGHVDNPEEIYPDGMRACDKQVFRQLCRTKKLYILVRQTNPASLVYIDRDPGSYAPKPIFVKAKTADFDYAGYELAGLVVSFDVWKENAAAVFKKKKIEGVEKMWNKVQPLLEGGIDGAELKVDKDIGSRHYGCLMLRDKGWPDFRYICGDYDLKDIVEVGYENWNLAFAWEHRGAAHNEILLMNHDLADLMDELNRGMGIDMVQHGSEAQFAGHQDEPINVFYPDGRFKVLKDKAAVEQFYRTELSGPSFVPAGAPPEQVGRAAGIRPGIAKGAGPDPELIKGLQQLGYNVKMRRFE